MEGVIQGNTQAHTQGNQGPLTQHFEHSQKSAAQFGQVSEPQTHTQPRCCVLPWRSMYFKKPLTVLISGSVCAKVCKSLTLA